MPTLELHDCGSRQVDRILEINGVKTSTCHPAHVLKGFVGKKVVLVVQSPGESTRPTLGSAQAGKTEVETGDCVIC